MARPYHQRGSNVKSGIYKITGPNGRFYIGQSVNIEGRWKYHRKMLRVGKHCNEKLQHAWNKYGESSFSFKVLVFCPVSELDRREQKFIDSLDAIRKGYNIAPLAASSRGVKNPSVAARNRLLRGKDHPSFGIPRPDVAAMNRRLRQMKGKKRPDLSARPRLYGPAHFNFGKRHPPRALGPVKLRDKAYLIKRRLAAGESISALSREFKVNYKTIEFIKYWRRRTRNGKSWKAVRAQAQRSAVRRRLQRLIRDGKLSPRYSGMASSGTGM